MTASTGKAAPRKTTRKAAKKAQDDAWMKEIEESLARARAHIEHSISLREATRDAIDRAFGRS
ncbi:MAG: hypothetical protein ABR548_04465 [Actinomycetota bacterium]|nr:hypothetical protein [Actinomycetota bacterium]